MNVALSNFAKEHQFREDKKRGVITGRQNGYEFVASERENKEISVLFSVKSDYDKKEEIDSALKQLQNKISEVVFYTYAGTNVKIHLKVKNTQDSQKIYRVVDEMSQSLQTLGFQNCCQTCENQGMVFPASIKGNKGIFCDTCFNKALQESESSSGNFGLGVVGAILGSLIGVAIWIGIYQLNIIAGIAGFLMFYFAFKGYQLLGKKKDKKGVIVSLVICIVMVLVAEFLGIVIAIMRELNFSFSNAAAFFEVSLQDSAEVKLELIKELMIGYGLMIVATYSSARQTFTEVGNDRDTVRL